MRHAVISDSHTVENIEFIYRYLKERPASVGKIDAIVINGDVFGEEKARPGYGYNYDRSAFDMSFDRISVLQRIAPQSSERLLRHRQAFTSGGEVPDEVQFEFARDIKIYIKERYAYLLDLLSRFSGIAPTFFNIGTHESPIHYKVLNELAFLLRLDSTLVRRIALLEQYRDSYHEFLLELKKIEGNSLRFIGARSLLVKRFIIAGIPGLNDQSVPIDQASELQEKITSELLNSIQRQMSYADNLIIYNHCDCKRTQSPFTFKPGSPAVRKFILDMKGKMNTKVFVQSYNHWITTHFFEADGFNFVLNNSAVNNCLFNIIEMSNKVKVFDVDPKLDKVRELTRYDSYVDEYTKPEDRLKLNYPDHEKVIEERSLQGCYYM